MITRHHPDPLPGEHPPAWMQNPTPDGYTRIAAALDAEDAADRANGVDVWDRVFPPPAPGVCDCDEPLVRDNRGNAVDLGEPWPRGWLGNLIVNALFYAVWLAFGAAAGWAAIRLGGAL